MESKNKIINKFNVLIILLFFLTLLYNFYCSSNNNGNQEQMDSDDILEYYSTQSKQTDPGKYAHLYEGIPSDVSQIVNIVQGVVLHLAQVEIANIPVPKNRVDREIHLNSVEKMLKCISQMDERSFILSRQINKRMIGICTHFAMLTCSILRHKGIPARLRGGFETYHSLNEHHDHWICEYWNSSENQWIRIDPELNDFLKEKWNINFNNLDLSQEIFMTGADVWKSCRQKKENPKHFGIKGDKWIGGWDFVLNEMVLDFMALNKTELLPWDGNKLSEKGIRKLKNTEFTLLDKASELVIAGDESFNEMRALYKSNRKLQK